METTQASLVYPYDTTPPHGDIMELAAGVYWLQMPLPMSLNHINLYLLDDGDSWVVVDTGIRGEETRTYWQMIFDKHMQGKPVSRIICTHLHPDHTGQAGFIADYWQAPLLMSQAEYYQARVLGQIMTQNDNWQMAAYFVKAGIDQNFMEQMRKTRDSFTLEEDAEIPMPPSFTRLSDGDFLTIGGENWQVITGSGHSPEHVCLYSEKLRILISGDQVLPIITSNVSVFPTEPDGNPMLGWLESLTKFKMLVPNDTLVLPAHNAPFYGLHERLDELNAHHADRMLAIEETCVEPQTAVELLPVLFERTLEGHSLFMALGECVAHLHCLMTLDRIERQLTDGVYTYRSIDPKLESRATPGHHDAPDDSPLVV